MFPYTRCACCSMVLTASGSRPRRPNASRSSGGNAVLLLYMEWFSSAGPRQPTSMPTRPFSSLRSRYRSMSPFYGPPAPQGDARLPVAMIPRYSRPEMSRLWSDENRFAAWLRVEIAASEVLAGQGVVPAEALAAIKDKARFDVARIDAIEREVQHDVIAFVSNVAESVGPEGRWIHYGLTSSDVVDTALAMLMRDAVDLIVQDVQALREVIGKRAHEFKDAPMIGRTHGVHAEPMTFGLKLALWYAELGRALQRLSRARETIAVGKLSGAVGTFSHLGPEVEEAVCANLGLVPAPVSSQVLQRDRHAELMTALAITAASLEKFATEI